MLELVEFRPARSRNARPRVFKSAEVVARELLMFAADAEVTAYTNIGKFAMLVRPGDDLREVISRHQREVRKLNRWNVNRRITPDRRRFKRIDSPERRQSV
jgi:hypothetical protein